MPSHLVSAETGFPQGAAQNGPSAVPAPAQQGQLPSTNITNVEDAQAPIESMTREEGDGEGAIEVNSESN